MSAHSERYGSSFPRFPLKYWDLIFSENRPPGDPDSWLEALRLIREDAYTNDPIKLFMEQYEVHHPKVEKLGLFTAGTSPSNLSEDSQCEGRAWLDDRCEVTSHGGGTEPSAPGTLIPRVYRQYDGHLSASKLKDHLSEKRYGHKKLCDVHRRLIYVADLDPTYFLALVETVPDHMVDALRDAVCKHLSLQASLRVKINGGFSTFCLQFHIPFYAWGRVAVGQTPLHRNGPRSLAFLTDEPTSGFLFEAHLSIALIGTGDRRWTGLCFDDTYFDPDRAPGSDQFAYDTDAIMDDPIFTEGNSDANQPIWDARVYFIMAVRERMTDILDQWEIIVSKVEAGIKDMEAGIKEIKKTHPLFSAPLSATPRSLDKDLTTTVLDRIDNTSELVDNLLEKIVKTCEMWHRFSAPDGDVLYFLDSNPRSINPDIRDSLIGLGEAFKDLGICQRDLESYKEKCRRFMRDVIDLRKLQETVENKQEVQRNGTTAQTNILAVAPATIVSAFFAIPANVMAFNRSPANFVCSFLAVAACLQLLNFLVEKVQRRIRRGKSWRHLQERWKRLSFKEADFGNLPSGSRNGTLFRRHSRRRDTADTSTTLVTDAIPLEEV